MASVLHVLQRDPLIIVLDAGMTELIRPALYGAEHLMTALTSLGQSVDEGAVAGTMVQVHGPICESTDRLGEARMPPFSGATSCRSASPAPTRLDVQLYNGRPRPPEVGWDGAELSRL